MKKTIILLCFVLVGLGLNAQSNTVKSKLMEAAKTYVQTHPNDSKATELVQKGEVTADFNKYFKSVSTKYNSILKNSRKQAVVKPKKSEVLEAMRSGSIRINGN